MFSRFQRLYHELYILLKITYFSLIFLYCVVIYICKDSICNDPKLVLGSNTKGPNNKFVERGYQRTRLTSKEKRLNSTFLDGLT